MAPPESGGEAPDAPRPRIFSEEDRLALHTQLDKALDDVEVNPRAVTGFKTSKWETVTKDADSNPVITTLHGFNLLVSMHNGLPEWPVVQPADKVIIRPVKTTRQPRLRDKRAVILPDPQFGFRFYSDTGEYDPFHDENALNVALQVIREAQPDLVLCLGDFIDLPEWSKYEQTKEFADTTQRSVNRGHLFLAQIRAAAPNTRIVVLEGNHDRRMQIKLQANALYSFGIRRATDTSGWPVMTVPYLCAFDAVEAEYVEGYPAGAFWINERLKCIHGKIVRSGGSTAGAVSLDETSSVLFGHIHRIEMHGLTKNIFGGGRTTFACSPGCLCRIDGAVPGVKGSTILNGRPVLNYENWQQGLAVVDYKEGNSPFALEVVGIDTLNGYATKFGDKVFRPTNLESAA